MESLKQLSDKIRNKVIRPADLVEECKANITKYDDKVHACLSVLEGAVHDAETVEAAIANGNAGPAAGIPYVAKDNISVRNVRMTAGSRMLEDYVSPYNATIINKLDGAVLLAKMNLDAFAFGASTENSGYFVTRNPWDLSKVAGGSSGGSAAGVASGMGLFGLGTDTGGSIRQPAAFCGVVGLKPTYGRASRYGLAAMGSSLDCPGPITTQVLDAAFILNQIAGEDPKDGTTVPVDVPDYTALTGTVKGVKVGLPKEFFSEKLVAGLDPNVKEQVLSTVKILEKLGAEIIEVSMPYSVYALPAYYIITPSEISANMSRYDGIRYGSTKTSPEDLMDLYLASRATFEDEVKRRIFVGNYSLSAGYYDAYYNKAMQVRTLIIDEMKKVFEKVDVIVGPTAPTPAFDVGENTADPVLMYLADIYTVTANIAGIPAISIPCGLAEGLPVGFQILGKHFDEKMILNVAYALEQDIQFREKYKPELLK